MPEAPQPLTQHELDRILRRRESAETVLMSGAILAATGVFAARYFAPAAILVAVAFVAANGFYWRYILTPCPRCTGRFLSVWHILVFGLPAPVRCSKCGVQVPRAVNGT